MVLYHPERNEMNYFSDAGMCYKACMECGNKLDSPELNPNFFIHESATLTSLTDTAVSLESLAEIYEVNHLIIY
jgi:hypothetical protein